MAVPRERSARKGPKVAAGGHSQDRGDMASDRLPRRSKRRETLLIALQIGMRGTATAAALLAAYYLTPVRAKTPTQEVLWLVAALGVFVAVIAVQVRAIVKSRHPQFRAIEAVAIPLFLIVFARIYLTVSSSTSRTFSLDLDPTRALYFRITVFSTVGFGDIAPQTDFARLIVSVQMLLDLVVLGAIVRVLFAAVERGISNRGSEAS
jgi:voltage-gated potassium channel